MRFASGLKRPARELLLFGFKEARACVFPVLFFAILFLSKYVPLFGLPRYDFIFLAVLGVQALLLLARIETRDEVLVLCVFHAIGLGLEIFKTHPAVGSWSYPEEGFLKIFGVPLYSGFMYAAVAGYMCQSWRLLDLELKNYPPYIFSVPLYAGIHLNFFTHHFVWDLRWALVLGVFVVFWKTSVRFSVAEQRRRSMPLVVSFFLIGFFVWVAENISTYLGAWVYPERTAAWNLVSFGKISSWFLLVIVSFILVADLKHVKEARQGQSRKTGRHAGRENLTSSTPRP
ncbi:MAG: DUF817 domain-containing protein [Actinomycetota bacterium]|nr:DUF817 domain-containing protein [Actinomycetota bacterium]